MRNIAVAGTGYVGLSTGTCFADMGNKVTCIDISEEKIAMLQRGESPIYEPGLSEMIVRNVKAGRLHFTTSYEEALNDAEFIFICVGTPSGVDGEADLQYVRMAAESVATHHDHPLIVINKSTVPVGTGDWVADIVRRSQQEPIDFAVVSCPEFTREGSAIYDFMNSDRVVVGSRSHRGSREGRTTSPASAHTHYHDRPAHRRDDQVRQQCLSGDKDQLHQRDRRYLREIGRRCARSRQGMGFDRRIGAQFLNAGLAMAAVASRRMSRRSSTWRSCTARTRRCCAPSSTSTATCGGGQSSTCVNCLAASWTANGSG
jgi:UDPglucose 6-dehydrogenase